MKSQNRHPDREHRWIDETSLLLNIVSNVVPSSDTEMRAQGLAFLKALVRFALETDPTRGFGDFHTLVLQGDKTLEAMAEVQNQSIAAVARFVLAQSDDERVRILSIAEEGFQPWAYPEKEKNR